MTVAIVSLIFVLVAIFITFFPFGKDKTEVRVFVEKYPPTQSEPIVSVVKIDRWGNKYPPRPMTKIEKHFWDKKPDLTFWYRAFGASRMKSIYLNETFSEKA